jgi:hypothetical protein
MRLRMIILICGAWFVSTTLGADAQQPLDFEGCFVRDYPRRAGTRDYANIEVAIRSAPADGVSNYSVGAEEGKGELVTVDFSYAFWSLPKVALGLENFRCPRQNGKITCTIECSGQMKLLPLINGDLLLSADRMEIDTGGVSSLIVQDPAENFTLRGTHVLRRVGPGRCLKPKPESDRGGIVLQQGDYHPFVRQLSAQLAKLGFLTAPGTSFFSDEIAAALRAFQANARLEPSGVADARTIRLLNVRSVAESGC